MTRKVYAELRNGLAVRIFKTAKAAILAGVDAVEMLRADAVSQIRLRVFERADYRCQNCGAYQTWDSGHMDERLAKGKGGEVSLENCQLLCAKCHVDPTFGKHKDRFPKFNWLGSKRDESL